MFVVLVLRMIMYILVIKLVLQQVQVDLQVQELISQIILLDGIILELVVLTLKYLKRT